MQNTTPNAQQPLNRPRRQRRLRRRPWLWVTAALVACVVTGVAFVGVGLYTDRPEFCVSCHEMQPYYDAWLQGNHGGKWCVDCHVGPGYPARLAHKFSAMSEVVAHYRGDTSFPRSKPIEIADAQCVRCHTQVPSGTASGFDHSAHAARGACQACHSQSGHAVTAAALTGVQAFNPSTGPGKLVSVFARVDGGAANLRGHVTIPCSRCHDLAKTGCERCHKPKHTKNRPGACTTCHQPGPKFAFTHPTSEDCAQCHSPSATHFKPAAGDLAPCTRCHTQAGKSWAFAHPPAAANCADCHAVPAGHKPPNSPALNPCTACHKNVGANWKFAHPSASANCQSCHTPPANHSSGQCSACHHKTGVSWAFAHPSAGEHSYTSRPCAACHPNGYSAVFCTCHGNTSGPG